MKFLELNADVVDLRKSLLNFVGEAAFSEITVRPPVSHSDEASFIRLVSWSYALFFEAGRVTIPYLLRLPGNSRESQTFPQDTLQLVHILRTWTSHNLGLSEHDVTLSRKAMHWMRTVCHTDSPSHRSEWYSCFNSLCLEISKAIKHCKEVINVVLLSPGDGDDTIAELRRRIDRNWPAHKFDEIVGDICVRFGEQLDIKKFRNPRLQTWLTFLAALPAGGDLEHQMVRRIERDLLDYFNNMLPIDGRDIMKSLEISQGPQVKHALNYARTIYDPAKHDKESLLNHIRESYNFEVL